MNPRSAQQQRDPVKQSLILEIGTEEIPARFLPGALADLKRNAEGLLQSYRIDCGETRTYATPRRLVLAVRDISTVQNDSIKEVFGPSKKAAFDDQGNPTKAAAGFAQSVGIKVSDLVVKKKGKGDYVAAVIEETGADTKSLLPEMMKNLILSLHFPKSMRWGDGSLTFARPIHWILGMFGNDPIKFELYGIKSGIMTRGHRFLSPASFQIREISSFLSLLENNFVLLDHEKRKRKIRSGISKLFENSEYLAVIDEELLNTVTFLVEYPTPVLCSFHEKYLDLPQELLVTVMKDHQKYFSVQDREGNLAHQFVVVSNTRAENAETVRIGAERVIKARFDDARFYFSEDRKRSLSDRVDDLKQVTFHDELGTLFDKTGRLAAIAAFLSDIVDPSLKDKLSRAARLSKTDLITGVVREFPELQGTMARYYAVHDQEDSDVAQALEEQYLPQSFGGKLPGTDVGALLGISDKLDNLTSFFSIGLIPTGSEDPFALRRQAMGIVAILFDREYPLTISQLSDKALENVANLASASDARQNLISFFEQRIEFALSSSGYATDIIKSVLSLSSSSPLSSVKSRVAALDKFRTDAIYADFILAMKRVNNILPEKVLACVNHDLLILDEEKNLFKALLTLRDEFMPLFEKGEFYDGLRIFSRITGPVNDFFDKVLVMDKKEEIKTNRLSLLSDIWSTAVLIADFSKLL